MDEKLDYSAVREEVEGKLMTSIEWPYVLKKKISPSFRFPNSESVRAWRNSYARVSTLRRAIRINCRCVIYAIRLAKHSVVFKIWDDAGIFVGVMASRVTTGRNLPKVMMCSIS